MATEATQLLPTKPQYEQPNGRGYKLVTVSAVIFLVLLCTVVVNTGGDVVAINHQLLHSSSVDDQSKNSVFPTSFLWGAATSAYQIEGGANDGGRGPSIWDTWCTQSRDNCNGESGDVADDHFHKWQEDVYLMEQMRLKAYRFSISWSRILPNGTAAVGDESGDARYSKTKGINYDGILYYNNLIDSLLESGIEPFITLYHWDLPQSLQDRYGGWEDRSIIEDFARYARICFQFFGDRVKYWITINEAWTVSVHGYEEGSKAPGVVGEDVGGTGRPYLVGHHLLLAHARAVDVYRSEGYEHWYRRGGDNETGLIGIANSGDYRFPLNPDIKGDVKAATRAMEFQLGWFSDPIWRGDYPKSMRERLGKRLPQFTRQEKKLLRGSADFLGLNHYSSAVASEPTSPPIYGGYWADQFVNVTDDPSWKKSFMGWNIAPDGAREMLLWIDRRYNHPLVFVTENGMAANEPDLEHSLHDEDRIEYLEGYIRGFSQALSEGAKLGGYFAWSLLDNL